MLAEAFDEAVIFSVKIEKSEMDGASCAYGRGEACTGFW
jgi:hypothetical protein